jgi:putative ABC transport system ATP-binding protein
MLAELHQIEYRSILTGIDLTITAGDFVIVVGSNGSGKSTLLKLLDGSIQPTGGAMNVSAPVVRLCQDLEGATFGALTVYENLSLASRKQLHRKDAAEMLEGFHPQLPDRLDLPVEQLSGGQRQALALALCLVQPCGLLLLDEHTSALDPAARDSLMELTAKCASEGRVQAVVMVTHDLGLAHGYGNRLLQLREGRIAVDCDSRAKASLSLPQLAELYVGASHVL